MDELETILGEEDDETIMLMIEQKKIECRPHEGLDHNAEKTKKLPCEKRTQFRHTTQRGSSSTEDATMLRREDDRPPEDPSSKEEHEPAKGGVRPCSRARRMDSKNSSST